MIAAGLLMAVTIGGALFAVMTRNVLHAIFGLAIALFGVAGLFLTLNSPFVAAMEILIYVGGISVAMIFAVMLSTVVMREPDGVGRQLLAALVALAFLGAVGVVISRSPLGPETDQPEAAWSVAAIGASLLSHYNLVFEALSVVLLLAIVGSISIARKERVREGAVGVVAMTATVDPDGDEEVRIVASAAEVNDERPGTRATDPVVVQGPASDGTDAEDPEEGRA